MKLNAVGVKSSNFADTIRFYKALGFSFPDLKSDDQHIESITEEGGTRLMIDSVEMIKSITGENPVPANHSVFAIEYSNPAEVNEVAEKVKLAGFTVFKEPWDAFWHQRYSIVQDPDGYKIDLYAAI